MSVINRGPVTVDCCLMTDCYLQLFLDQLDNTKKILRTGSDCQIPERTQSEFSMQGKNNFVSKIPTKLNLR